MDLFRDARSAVAFAPDKMKKVNLFDTEHMFCDVYGLAPGQEQAAHAHADSDKVYFVLDGSATFHIGNEERRVGSGHAVLAPAGISHAVRNPGPEPVSLLVFMAPKPGGAPRQSPAVTVAGT
jgi:mannose-6-phosphate isomerase-like protein (cupin superfamily)